PPPITINGRLWRRPSLIAQKATCLLVVEAGRRSDRTEPRQRYTITVSPSHVPTSCSISTGSRSGGCASASIVSISSRHRSSRTDVTNTCTLASKRSNQTRGMHTLPRQASFDDDVVHEFTVERPHETVAMKYLLRSTSPRGAPISAWGP